MDYVSWIMHMFQQIQWIMCFMMLCMSDGIKLILKHTTYVSCIILTQQ